MKKQEADNERLLKLVKSGDKKAREEVIVKNLALVQYVLNRETKRLHFQDQEDVFEQGVVGLIKAVDAYKFGKTQFQSFAYTCIKNEIFMYFRQARKHYGVLSIEDRVPGADDELTIKDMLKSDDDLEENAERSEALQQLKQVVDTKLTDLQKQIVTERYFSQGEKLQHEIAKDLGISQSYCSRQERCAMQILRDEIVKQEDKTKQENI